MRFLCVGQAIGDLYLHPVNPDLFDGALHLLDGIPIYGGGDANNASIDLAKIGEDVCLATAIGADMFGDKILKLLEEAGVSTKFVRQRTDMPTSVHVIFLGDNDLRANGYMKGTGQCVAREDIPNEAIDWAEHVHMVSVLSQPVLDGEGVASIMKYAKENGKTTSMDLQYDLDMYDPSIALEKVAMALPYCDIFLPSISEAQAITGGITDPLELKEFFSSYELKIFGCKLGAKGAYLTDFKQDIFIPSLYPGIPVDSLGAGDAFCSGFISAYKRGFSLKGCGLIASAASAKICGVIGCNAGMRPFDELVDYAKEMGYDPE